MKVYGADFSGARDASRGIFYAGGTLRQGTLLIEQVVHCDDRLDLLAAIHFSRAPWGLDFPFSITIEAMKSLNISGWEELLEVVANYERSNYDLFISGSGIDSCEARCLETSVCCRAVDAGIKAFSPLKKTNPNMRMMTYAGLKLLAYLRRLGNTVYPFDCPDRERSRLYEVYPSHTWLQLGLSHSLSLEVLLEQFQKRYNLKLEIEDHLLQLESLDAADAVAACITVAYGLDHYDLEVDWSRKHSWISDAEWERRQQEGLVLQIN